VIMRKLLPLIIILLALFFIGRGWWNSQLAAVSNDTSTQVIVVSKGETFGKLASKLKQKGLIKSPWAFTLLAKQTGLGSKIQTGSFKVSPSMSAKEVLETLTSQPSDYWVTLLEGWRIEEMAQELSSKFQVPSSKFIKLAKEGYMFPDTYLFARDVTEEQIVQRLENTFNQKYTENLRAKIRASGLTENQGVILASVVEREARSDQVRQMVASIMLKRYKIGMALNADATIQYALGYQQKEKSWWKRHLTKEDLKVNSPFNTYLYAGLPPGPIANPSLSSLTAVANANPSTPYLYYYHDSKGNSYYAETLEEHNANVANHP